MADAPKVVRASQAGTQQAIPLRPNQPSFQTQPPAIPAKPAPQPALAKAKSAMAHTWPREAWVLIVFIMGLTMGAVGTLAVTTSLFPIAQNATASAFITGQATGAALGKR